MASSSSSSTPAPSRTDSAASTNATNPSSSTEKDADASYRAIYTTPPPVKTPYKPTEALGDLAGVSYALDQFLASRMHESEEYMNERDPKKERLYFATGYGLIQCVKGLMSYADEDLLAAIGHTKQGVLIASQHRKKQPYLASRLAGYVVSSLNTTGVNFVKTMTDVERHAELVYAESLFEKALLGIVYSGDWLAFIKEALNMRTTITIYRTLYKYVCAVDAEYAASLASSTPSGSSSASSTPGSSTPNTNGASTSTSTSGDAEREEALEVLGRAGGWGAHTSPSSPRPSTTSDAFTTHEEDAAEHAWEERGPTISTEQEGVRRAICDMALLIFHLVLSSYTFHGVDTKMAARIVAWNLKRYPEGACFVCQFSFFWGGGISELFESSFCGFWVGEVLAGWDFGGVFDEARRDYVMLDCHAQAHEPGDAWAEVFNFALVFVLAYSSSSAPAASRSCVRSRSRRYTTTRKRWRRRSNIGICIIYRSGKWLLPTSRWWRWGRVLSVGGCWEGEATWSKSIYSYGVAVCLLDSAADGEGEKERKGRLEEARKMMERVPGLRQKIAGKSIPLEKFVARRARKFQSQNNRLLLPSLELAYVFLGIAHAPRAVVESKMLPSVRNALSDLEGTSGDREKGKGKEARQGYWDDYCLARFLEGVCLRYVAFPDPDAVLPPGEVAPSAADVAKIAGEARGAFERVFEDGPRIELDHHLVYHAHYEYGRLLACMDDADGARKHFELVLSGKPLEVGPSGRKVGKYSMENALHMRTQAALEALTLSTGAKKRRL
ncbi:hypothetical protein MSAN_02010900 [Mycena sanguinolenta]|uniref:Uncharacterized protein n=1 Tax=Mycena sanguinolenta TaxID=230812 RepID=A0A8H6XLB0_9AGAR|nr:hypothetical protein MSAN_02010900 [Mycena sanguinolenta]